MLIRHILRFAPPPAVDSSSASAAPSRISSDSSVPTRPCHTGVLLNALPTSSPNQRSFPSAPTARVHCPSWQCPHRTALCAPTVVPIAQPHPDHPNLTPLFKAGPSVRCPFADQFPSSTLSSLPLCFFPKRLVIDRLPHHSSHCIQVTEEPLNEAQLARLIVPPLIPG
jgi:hypothetical protein